MGNNGNLSLKTSYKGAGAVAQAWLPSKYEVLSSNSSAAKKDLVQGRDAPSAIAIRHSTKVLVSTDKIKKQKKHPNKKEEVNYCYLQVTWSYVQNPPTILHMHKKC
jgi:hypothetical protein